MIKAVLFDMDGTLSDSERYYIDGTRFWLSRLGYDFPMEKIYPIVGKNEEELHRYLSSLTGMTPEEAGRRNSEYFDHEAKIDYSLLLFPDVKETLEELKRRGIRTALVSGSSMPLVERFLKQCELEGIFDVTVSTIGCFPDKPDPAVYRYAMKQLAAEPEECIIVEDSRSGIEAGKRAGSCVIARDASKYHIDQSKADRIIRDLREIMEVIDER
ncbi:MAG: HAD family phosphatase [Erysipelotrichaceae bacterium]|nr:HAD family phosphatase [Erysipelotrichaceae bacterium]